MDSLICARNFGCKRLSSGHENSDVIFYGSQLTFARSGKEATAPPRGSACPLSTRTKVAPRSDQKPTFDRVGKASLSTLMRMEVYILHSPPQYSFRSTDFPCPLLQFPLFFPTTQREVFWTSIKGDVTSLRHLSTTDIVRLPLSLPLINARASVNAPDILP
jgi:hypothetical protein